MAKCQRCDGAETYIRLISETKTETFCLSCCNSIMAEELEVEAESYPEGVTIRDGEGRAHQFRLRKRLVPMSNIMEAKEQNPSGYHFTVHCKLNVDQGKLFLDLIANAERGMAETFIKEGQFPKGQFYHLLQNDRLAGRIESSRMSRMMDCPC